MNSLVTDAEILSAMSDADPVTYAALDELRRHRADARARGALPIFVPGQPSAGEMTEALGFAVYAGPNSTDRDETDAVATIRGVIREVLHLREQVTRVQTIARVERDRRMAAEKKLGQKETENAALMRGIVALHESGLRAAEVGIVTRSPLNMPPIEDRSPRWQEASARIEAATNDGRDPDPADLEIVLSEHLKHEGFDAD